MDVCQFFRHAFACALLDMSLVYMISHNIDKCEFLGVLILYAWECALTVTAHQRNIYNKNYICMVYLFGDIVNVIEDLIVEKMLSGIRDVDTCMAYHQCEF